MTQENTPSQKPVDTLDNAFELYKLIIEENRHLHNVWIDNFRIILTFNSILLAGALGLFTILSKTVSPSSSPAFTWSLRAISIIGTIVTLVGIQIIRRAKQITSLRLGELRHLETTFLQSKIPLYPFAEGALVLGMSTEDIIPKTRPNPPSYPLDRLKFNPFSGFGGYVIIGISFFLTYIVIFILSLF